MRVLLWVGLWIMADATMTALGAWLLIAPARAGAFLHDAYAVFPPPASTTASRAGYRLLGAALVAFSLIWGTDVVRSALRVVGVLSP